MGNEIQGLGKMLLIAGAVMAAVGALLMFSGRLPWLGRLPGDIFIRKQNFTFYFPLATSIIASILLTIFLSICGRR